MIWYLYCLIHVKTGNDFVGVDFKPLKIQLIICSVFKILMTSQMCESKSNLQPRCRVFQKSNFYSGLLLFLRSAFARRRLGGIDFFCSLIISQILGVYGKFLFLICFVYELQCLIALILENSSM